MCHVLVAKGLGNVVQGIDNTILFLHLLQIQNIDSRGAGSVQDGSAPTTHVAVPVALIAQQDWRGMVEMLRHMH